MSKIYKLSFFLFIAFMTIQCTGSKSTMGASKTKKGLFKEFFVGDDGTQYFINPLSFENNSSKSDMAMDFTFRYKNEIKDSATVNFTIVDDALHKRLDNISIENSNITAKSNELTLLYNEANNTDYTSRFSFKVTVAEINELFKDGQWTVRVVGDDYEKAYVPTKNTLKAVEGLNHQLFVLMR